MTDPSEILRAARALLGHETPAETRPPVTLEEVRRYCYAVDDLNPIYLDEETAARGRHGGIVSPPLFTGVGSFRPVPLSQLREDGLPSAEGDQLRTYVPGAQSRLTGADIELLAPVRPGDVLTRRSRLVDLYERQGRSGPLLFSVRETSVTNQRGERVCVERSTTAAVLGGEGGPSRPPPTYVPASQPASVPPHPTSSPAWLEVRVGDLLPEMVRVVSPVQAFLYGAVKGNSHRIHYDREYAAREGLPERVAQGDLLGDLLCQLAVRWMGPAGVLRRFSYEVRGPGFLGEAIVHHGRVARTWREDETGLVSLELWSEGAGGRLCLRGSAVGTLPDAGGP